MDEDLRELLDDVEKRLCSADTGGSPSAWESSCRDGKHGKEKAADSKLSATKPGQSLSGDTDDIDVFLEELLKEDDSQLKEDEMKRLRVQKTSAARRCCPVFLGGSSVTKGVGTASTKRSCDQLRCTSCDFRVLMFDELEWDPSCDYLFFRNNMPDPQKLGARLKRRSGSRAYACQCSWFSSRELTDLRDQPHLRWFCGKHQD
ncbi:protein C8orf37 homolog isoform X2 [Thalassophryne amazonica]|uniref:protein C8orf37 homolog isoform X2 n=1 Tax=Thalassophryne amazonica TaxID=390379 RepID=UPI001470E1AE|nr:protein C8orf37 homolog isoform X2 [Thalassophryne amazonica]